MKALIIIVLLLTIILLIPIGVDGGYSSNGYSLNLKIGFLNLHVLPQRIKPKKKKKIEKAKKKRKKKHIEKKEKEKEKKDLTQLVRPILNALSRFRKKLTINYLRLYLVVASDDPANTAIYYGCSQAILGGIIPLIDNAFNIKERDIGSNLDFFAEKMRFDIWINATIQIWELFYIAIAMGIDYLKLKRDKKKTKEQIPNKETGDAVSEPN